MNNPINLINFVESFQEVVNRHAVDEILAMLSEDAEFEIVGQSKLTRAACGVLEPAPASRLRGANPSSPV